MTVSGFVMPLDQKISQMPSILFFNSPVIIAKLLFGYIDKVIIAHFDEICKSISAKFHKECKKCVAHQPPISL